MVDDAPDDAGVLEQQIVAAHARLAGQAGRHHDDVRLGRVGVVVRAEDALVVVLERRRLGEVERLALRQALDDVDQVHVGDARFGDPLGRRGADVAGADDRYLATTDWHLDLPLAGRRRREPARCWIAALSRH